MKKIFFVLSLLLLLGAGCGKNLSKIEKLQVYKDEKLGFSFLYPKEWGNVQVKSVGPDQYVEGTKVVLGFEKKATEGMDLPSILVESKNYIFKGPGDGENIKIKSIDFSKSDEELAKMLKRSSTTNLTFKRVTKEEKQALVIYEEGTELGGDKYSYIYYVVPEYNEAKDNLIIFGNKTIQNSVKLLFENLDFDTFPKQLEEELSTNSQIIFDYPKEWGQKNIVNELVGFDRGKKQTFSFQKKENLYFNFFSNDYEQGIVEGRKTYFSPEISRDQSVDQIRNILEDKDKIVGGTIQKKNYQGMDYIKISGIPSPIENITKDDLYLFPHFLSDLEVSNLMVQVRSGSLAEEKILQVVKSIHTKKKTKEYGNEEYKFTLEIPTDVSVEEGEGFSSNLNGYDRVVLKGKSESRVNPDVQAYFFFYFSTSTPVSFLNNVENDPGVFIKEDKKVPLNGVLVEYISLETAELPTFYYFIPYKNNFLVFEGVYDFHGEIIKTFRFYK